MILADIATGHTDLADVAFGAALIVAAVAAVLLATSKAVAAGLVAAAVALLAFGLMVL